MFQHAWYIHFELRHTIFLLTYITSIKYVITVGWRHRGLGESPLDVEVERRGIYTENEALRT